MRMLEGIYPATVTPFGDDGMFSPQLMAKIIRYQLDAGVDGFFLCGGTGEGLLLSREERESLLEFVLSEVSGQVGVIAHVGAYQTAETLALARHASEAGANAIAALPPFPKISVLPLLACTLRIASLRESSRSIISSLGSTSFEKPWKYFAKNFLSIISKIF